MNRPLQANLSVNIVSRTQEPRRCRCCKIVRPLVLFPKWKDGRHSHRCQICTDSGTRMHRDVEALVSRSKYGARVQAKMKKVRG